MATETAGSRKLKLCCQCGDLKPLSSFHRNAAKADGVQSWCMECRADYEASPEGRSARYERQAKAKDRQAEERRRRQVLREQDGLFPQKQAARSAVYRAKRRGLIQAMPCYVCGAPADCTEAHHEDYADKLNVWWLCVECHRLQEAAGWPAVIATRAALRAERTQRLQETGELLLQALLSVGGKGRGCWFPGECKPTEPHCQRCRRIRSVLDAVECHSLLE